MKILAVRHAVPSLVMSNEEVIAGIAAAPDGRDGEDDLTRVRSRVRQFLANTGTMTRHKLGPNESAIDVLNRAIGQAFDTARITPEDLEFIIYAGVSRGWLEPSMAAAVQHEIGARNATCFDILEACASWLRAVQVAQAFCRAGTYRRGMIVNCECATAHLLPPQATTADTLRHTLPAYTIGEAATATVVARDDDSDLYVAMRSFGAHYALCMIPLESATSFSQSLDRARHPPNLFFSKETLFLTTIGHLIELYFDDPRLHERAHDLYFSHAASAKAGAIARKMFGIPEERWYCTHARFGNTVAASVPLAMSTALDEGILTRGKRILCIIGSAGISVGYLSLTF
jgi:3-oxoacyl-[acyl-carrier-protein] synthase III